MTLSFGVGLTIRSGPWVVAINESSLPPSTDPKGKRAGSPSLVEGSRKVKKNRGPPPDLTSSSSKVPIMEVEEEVRASLDLGDTPPVNASDAPKERENGSTAIAETRAEANKAQAMVMESSMLVTRSTMKAKATMTKVK